MTGLTIPARTLRTVLAAGFVAAAVLFTQSQDTLREVTRPIVLGILQACGIPAADQGSDIAIKHLEIPWTRDCAGINLLLIMLALAVWVNREEGSVLKFWLRVAAMVPAALAANVLRVLTLIGYRMVAYPAVESPQTHYFMGFLWMVPFVTAITPRAGRPTSHALFETLHAAAVIALLAPMTGMPNGSMMTIAVVVALSQCRFRQDFWKWRVAGSALWMLAGAAVALSNLESFWLPWLLCCPLLLDLRWAASPAGALVLLSTQSMLAMQSWAPFIGWPGIGLALLSWLKKSELEPPLTFHPASWTQRATAMLAMSGFIMPFLASTLLSRNPAPWQPPDTVRFRSLGGQGFEVQIPGQAEGLALACYGAESRDRHHTVKVCLKYRGTELSPTPQVPAVYSDDKHWLREFFLQDGRLLTDYPAYLKSTFRPGAEPGVHLIFIAPQALSSPQEFASNTAKLATAFHELCQRGDSGGASTPTRPNAPASPD
jgi:exosortase/archaeosortase family protein